ncbi:MAG: hypothetical protein ABIT37_00930 [Luteolibacter sp.]
MSRNPIDWPVIGHFTAADSSGRHHRIEVRQRPGSSGSSVGGELWSITSEVRGYFLDSGMPVNAARDEEGVFFSIASDEIYRKI